MKRLGALLLVVPVIAGAQQSGRSEVPVSAVVLFSSGVGYFEHSGVVKGGTATELRFRTSQLNDVIKSLVLEDLDGGRVNTITYPSQDPLSKTLKSFQVDITNNPSLAQLLNQLRGSRVSIQTQGERLNGTILGIEMRAQLKPDRDNIVEVPILNVVSAGTIRSIELQAVTSLTLDDPQLQEELAKALVSLTQARDQDKKPVQINFNGGGDRRVRLGYVVEAPVWKTSYRLLLDGKTADLQGWGIVENQTESDWNGVTLSLVSGRPMSFVMDLYSPQYVTRPLMRPETYAQVRPQVYAGGTGQTAADSALRSRVPFAVNRLEAVVTTGAAAANGEIRLRGMNAASSVSSAAETQQIGELFEFTVRNVTLPRQKSAMIPIVTDHIEAERVSIYNAGVMATNPLTGVRLKNTTGKSLLQGPVTVLDKGNYAGDARIGDLPAGQERLLSYGIDLEVLVNSQSQRSTVSFVSASIERGLLTVEQRMKSARDYVIDNKSARDRVIVIEHPRPDGWKLVDSPAPYESTNQLHRFRVAVPAGKVVTTTIREETVMSETVEMADYDVDALLAHSKGGEVPKAVRAAIERAVTLRRTAEDLEAQIAARTRRITEVSTEQNRLRENMKVVGQASQYYERLLSKLNEQESQIERLQRERDELTTRRDNAAKELREYLAGLTLK